MFVEFCGRFGIQALIADKVYYAIHYATRKRHVFSHITVGSNDLDAAGGFYDTVLIPLGLRRGQVVPDVGPAALCWIHPAMTLPRFYVYSPFNRETASSGNGSMVAFLAPAPHAVDIAYAAGMTAGGKDSGNPGPRTNYGEEYYGAYLFDPDGNTVHLAYRADLAEYQTARPGR